MKRQGGRWMSSIRDLVWLLAPTHLLPVPGREAGGAPSPSEPPGPGGLMTACAASSGLLETNQAVKEKLGDFTRASPLERHKTGLGMSKTSDPSLNT
jgi:hypothetical protein